MPLLPHNSPIIILPSDTHTDDASALAAVLDQHGARRILQLTNAALKFTSIVTSAPPDPEPVAKSQPKPKRGRPTVKPKPPATDECQGTTRAGLPCRRGPRCRMHLPPAPEPQHTAAPVAADNAPETPPANTDEPAEPEPPQSPTEPITQSPKSKSEGRRCPHCKADATMMETTRLPGNFIETRCHACGYRAPANQPVPTPAPA